MYADAKILGMDKVPREQRKKQTNKQEFRIRPDPIDLPHRAEKKKENSN